MKCGSPEEGAVLKWVASQARNITHAQSVLLFWSRSRGDAGDRSDFDIAIETNFPEKISELRAALDEKNLYFIGI